MSHVSQNVQIGGRVKPVDAATHTYLATTTSYGWPAELLAEADRVAATDPSLVAIDAALAADIDVDPPTPRESGLA